MNAEEVLLIRDIRRMFDKLPIDSARTEISVTRGCVTINGTIKSMRSQPLIKVKENVVEFERRLRRDPRVKILNLECRIMEAEKKEAQHFEAEHFGKEEEQKPLEPVE
jgi:hypothetical protein